MQTQSTRLTHLTCIYFAALVNESLVFTAFARPPCQLGVNLVQNLGV